MRTTSRPVLFCSSHLSIGLCIGLLFLIAGCRGDSILTYQPDAGDPFQGRWTERSSIPCEDGSQPVGAIGEIIFCKGRFGVTYSPFETFVDYRGDYSLDPETNALTMTVTGGNNIPDDLDLTGTVEFQEDGSIVLRDMFLGTEFAVESSQPACGHILE